MEEDKIFWLVSGERVYELKGIDELEKKAKAFDTLGFAYTVYEHSMGMTRKILVDITDFIKARKGVI